MATCPKVSKLTPTKPKPVNGSKHHKTVEESAADQELQHGFDFDKNFGRGADLWRSDEEFDEYLAWLRASRKEGR